MVEIVTDEHYGLVFSLFNNSEEDVRIISPFLSKKMADLLCESSKKGVNCSFITRFYLQDFLDGSNSLEGLQNMLDSGVKLYALVGLHTKLYLFGYNDAIVGSANFTEGGLIRNIELSVHLRDEEAIDDLHEYFEDLIIKIKNDKEGIITQEMLDEYKNKYKQQKEKKKKADGSTHVVATVRGATLDRKARDIREKIEIAQEEIENNKEERISDAVYIALGGKAEPVSHKSLNNIILKFSASSKHRADENKHIDMHPFIIEGKTIYTSNFSEAKKSSLKTIQEGDEIFLCVHSYDLNGNPCPMIVGKGIFRKFNSNNDARKHDWANKYEWLPEYPLYCVISEAKIINAPIKYGIPLREVTDALRYKTYMHTRNNSDKYTNERVARVHRQQAMLMLSPEAKEYIDGRLSELWKEYGCNIYKSEH